MTSRVDMIGKRFGKLVVIALSEERGSRGQLKYECLCDCGQTKIIMGEDLRRGKVKSCRCEQSRIASSANKTHGGSKERLYHVWQGIKNRCENENSPEYKNYGGRGIKICEEWHDYANFREFMFLKGYDPNAPKGECTIERIDINGDYEPANCTIITLSKQQRNKTSNKYLTLGGESKSVVEWAEELGVSSNVLYARIYTGMTDEEILTTPVRRVHKYTVNGETHSCKEWAEILQMPWSTLRSKLNKGNKTMEQVVNERRDIQN